MDYDDRGYKSDFKKEEDEKIVENSQDFIMRLPVLNHVSKIKNSIDTADEDLKYCNNEMQELKEKTLIISTKFNDESSQLNKNIMEDCILLTKRLRNMIQIEREETSVLKYQVSQLCQEKIKLQQNVLVVENRVCETEKDFGFKYLYEN